MLATGLRIGDGFLDRMFRNINNLGDSLMRASPKYNMGKLAVKFPRAAR